VDHHQRLALLHLRAGLLDLGDADREVRLVAGIAHAGTVQVHAMRDHRRVDRVHVATLRGRELAGVFRQGEF